MESRASWYMRDSVAMPPGAFAYVCAFLGAGVALLTGWLGGELVDRLGVGVDSGAHLDAPSSLSGRPAHKHASAGGAPSPVSYVRDLLPKRMVS
jgi:hypothetical protein